MTFAAFAKDLVLCGVIGLAVIILVIKIAVRIARSMSRD